VTTVVTGTAPHYLIADGQPLSVRRTRAGDAWAARQAHLSTTPGIAPPSPPTTPGIAPLSPPTTPGIARTPVLLGMPRRSG
jgi:tRNA-2-methylthio-N6-dimethylallyladenosine synthase